MAKEKVLTWKCEKCGKEISSLYQPQLNYNIEAHRLSCQKENNKNAM